MYITVTIRGLNFRAVVSAAWNLVPRHGRQYEFETNLNIRESIFRGCQSTANTAKISPLQKKILAIWYM